MIENQDEIDRYRDRLERATLALYANLGDRSIRFVARLLEEIDAAVAARFAGGEGDKR